MNKKWMILVAVAAVAVAAASAVTYAQLQAAKAVEEPKAVHVAQAVRNTELEELGRKLFKDETLSASGKMACASCHAEGFGHADKPGTHLPLGGAHLNVSGNRSTPTNRYLNTNAALSIDKLGNVRGGFTWDGRADNLMDQAKEPFFVSVEMAVAGSMEKPDDLLTLIRKADYYPRLQKVYANDDLSDNKVLFDRVAKAIEFYQREDKDYNQFDSRYDKHLAGLTELTAQEKRGLEIFNSPNMGNCATCHQSSSAENKPVFTDFMFRALAVPRNPKTPGNVADAKFYDLGLCKSDRSHPKEIKNDRYCGMFKTPTLRNIECTAPYFHNSAMASLEEAVRFHFTRDTQAATWYGSVKNRYNDLPAKHHINVAQGKPFDGSWQPTEADMTALIAFLKTLNDDDQKEELTVKTASLSK